MALNLNTSPYFDDFDGTKNYNRVLFKPGVAVQARELTQLQTALSDQLAQLGSFTLKDGAIISGCEETINKIKYVKVIDVDADGAAIENSDLSSYVGSTVTGGTTGLKAQIIAVRQGSTSSSTELKTLYLKYLSRNDSSTKIFDKTETLTVSSSNSSLNGNTFVTYDSGLDSVNPPGSRERYEGTAPQIQLSAGIIYALGSFIRTTDLATFIDPFTFNANRKIGFYVTEEVYTSNDDATLLDPADGSFNYNAPGADRLKLVVSLRSYSDAVDVPENFFQYASFQNRQIFRSAIKTDPLRNLGDIIAKRAYDANGSYNISGLNISTQEHLNDGVNGGRKGANQGGDADKIYFIASPGKANHLGYPVEYRAPYSIPVDKGVNNTQVEESVTQSTAYGNYVLVNELCGAWDIDGNDGADGDGIVDLYDTALDSVTSATFSSTAVTGNLIGRAKARQLVYESGTQGAAACQYRLYLYDIRMFNGTFADVENIVYVNDNAKGIADTVLEDLDGDSTPESAVLKEANHNKLLWNLPYAHIKTLAPSSTYDYDFIYQKEFDTSASAGGAITIDSALLQTGQTFTFGNGALTDTQILNNISVVAIDAFTSANSYAAGEFIDLTDASVTVTQNSETSLTIDLGGAIAAGNRNVRVYCNVQYSDVAPIGKTLQENKFVKIDATTNTEGAASGSYCLGISDVFRVVQITASDTSDYTTNAINVTDDFALDKGQRDNYYGLSYIRQKPSSTLNLSTYRYLAVKLDFFTHSVNGPTFATVDSYPIDDTGATGIKTEEVPVFSSSRNKVFDLRNCIDFRPYVTNTATTTGTLGSATENPSNIEAIDKPTNGLTNPSPVQEFTTDLEYYQGRGYKVYINQERKIKVELDTPKDDPKIPKTPPNSLVLAKGILTPYPCLASKAAQYYKRRDLQVSVEQVRTRRYTMRDIGKLDKRIKNLEYYTALSLLETEAKNKVILDTDGVDRFKNGLMIDAFKGFGTINTASLDHKCSLDVKKRQLRSAFDHNIIEFRPIAGGTCGQTGDMFHLKYDLAIYTSQLQASNLRNVVSELLYADPEQENPATADPPATPVIDPIEEEVVDPITPETTYALFRSHQSINEGQVLTIRVEAQNVTAGATVDWTVTGVSSADLSGASLTGTFTIDSMGDAEVSFTIAEDATTEGNETLTLTLDATDSLGNSTDSVSTSVIIVDTSVTPEPEPVPPPPPTPDNYTGSITLIPSEDAWFDLDYAEPAYVNINGQWDNFEITGSWDDHWGAWEEVSRDLVSPASEETIEHRVTGDPVYPTDLERTTTETTDAGVYTTVTKNYYTPITGYDETVTISAISRITEGRSGIRYFEQDYPDVPEETTVETEDIVSVIAATWIRPQVIEGRVEGLMPNAEHYVTFGRTNTGSITTNSQGRASFSISIGQGQYECGNIPVSVTDSNALDGITSAATTIFSANGEKRTLRKTYTTTRWVPPVGALPPIDIYEERAGGVVGGDREVKTTPFTDRIWDSTQETIFTPHPDDILVSTVCNTPADGTATETWMRWNASTYDVIVNDPSCEPVPDPPEDPSECDEGYYFNSTLGICVKQDANLTTVLGYDATTGDSNDARFIDQVVLVNNIQGNGPLGEDTEGVYETAIELITTQDLGYRPGLNTIDSGTQTTAQINATLEAAATLDINYDFDLMMIGDICLGDGYRSGPDPTAQSFFVTGMEGGMFVPNIKVFFRHIPNEGSANGIRLEIREMRDGVPSAQAVPNGIRHLRRSEVACSSVDGNGVHTYVPTTFNFANLVYLENNTEYAIVLIPDGNDPGYVVYTGVLGETQLGTTTRITKQAHGGVLFTSANNRTWTPHQNEDLMFSVQRCKFATSTDQTLLVAQKDYDWLTFDTTGWESGSQSTFDLGSAINGFSFAIGNSGGSGYSSPPSVAISAPALGGTTAQATATLTGGVVTAITLTDPGSGYTSEDTITVTLSGGGSPSSEATVTATLNRGIVREYDPKYQTFKVEVTDGRFYSANTSANPALTLVGTDNTYGVISSIENRVVSAYSHKVSEINPGSTGTITRTIALTDTGAGTAGSTYSTLDVNTTVELNTEKTIYSYSNEAASYSGDKTANAVFTLRSESNNVSPMIDMASMAMAAFKNLINNDASNEEVRFGGDSTMKYISKTVVLADGQEAEDMIVYLDNKIPNGTGVAVFGKFMSNDDDGNIGTDIPWKQLELEGSPLVATEGFAEYSYKIPAKGSSISGLNGNGVYEYDVDRISSIAVSSGGSGYSSPPTVTISHTGDGYGATAEAILSAGAVSEIRITNPGRGYTGGTITATLSGGSPSVAATLGTPVASTVTYTSYKYFAIKIVHTAPTTVSIPKSSGLRAYALQA